MPEPSRVCFKDRGSPIVAWTALVLASILALGFAVRHAPVAPYWVDEWRHVPVVTGHRPLTLEWLLAFHNEHRIPLPKLIWLAVERISGFDARWGAALNVAVLTGASALLLLGLRNFRGRTVWTDAVVPLLYLHLGHWHNMTWPFQIAFMLHALFVSLLLFVLLSLKGAPSPLSAVLFGAGLVALTLCGAPGLPVAVLLGGWWMWRLGRAGRPVQHGLVAAALLLAAAHFLGTRPPSTIPPSPGPGSSLLVGLQCLAGSIGPLGATTWPFSGILALIALALTVGMFLRAVHRNPESPAGGLLLALAGLGVMVVMIGHARAGETASAGFTLRYVTLSTLFPFLAVVAADMVDLPAGKAAARAAIVGLLAVGYLPGAFQAVDMADLRREAGAALVRDVEAGLPVRMVAVEHGFWCPTDPGALESGLAALAEARQSLYRRVAPPAPVRPDGDGKAATVLRDGRQAFELLPNARFQVPLGAGTNEIRLETAHFGTSRVDVRMIVRVLRGDASPEPVWSDRLPRSSSIPRRIDLIVHSPGAAALEVTVEPEEKVVTTGPQLMMIARIVPKK
jgi:hypothetical protein